MSEFRTIFAIEPGPSEIQIEIYFRLAVGLIALAVAVGLLLLYRRRRNTTKRKPKLFAVIFLHIWAIGWLSFTTPWLINANKELDSLLIAYKTGNYEVVEGPVQVLRTQPASGHAPGDLVSVGGRQFEINFFVATHAYHNTIAHGGYLRAGTYAKVFHTRGTILRIDVKNDITATSRVNRIG